MVEECLQNYEQSLILRVVLLVITRLRVDKAGLFGWWGKVGVLGNCASLFTQWKILRFYFRRTIKEKT